MSLLTGTYVVFEGPDGAGKTTILDKVAQELRCAEVDLIVAKQPGATPLGEHLRALVKNPASINPKIALSDYIRQILYIVDAIDFSDSILRPALAANKLALVDRSSFLSSIVYSMAEGLKTDDVCRILQLYTPPRIDRLYVFNCPYEVRSKRAIRKNDHYEQKAAAFGLALDKLYDGLLTSSVDLTMLVNQYVHLENVINVNAMQSPDQVADFILKDLKRLLKDRSV